MDMNNNNVDALLKKALKSTEKPDPQLLLNIKKNLIKEETNVNKKIVRRSLGTVAAAVLAFMVLTTTAFAAWYFLHPSEVADNVGNTALSTAFESNSAININESVTSGVHTFTLLAIVSGEDISDHPIYSITGEIQSDRTYAVVAVQKTDGSPMPSPMDETYEPFTVSPFIKGESHWRINAFTMDGGSITMVSDGILYLLADYANITIFADRGIYIGVNTGLTISGIMDAFVFNEQTGEITANPDYDGSSAVFMLPIDKSLADPVRAAEMLEANPFFQGVNDNNDGVLPEMDELDPPFFYDASQSLNDAEAMKRDGFVKMDYHTFREWIDRKLEEYAASGNYSADVIAMFRADYLRDLEAISNGYEMYLFEDANTDGLIRYLHNPADGEFTYSFGTNDEGRYIEHGTSDNDVFWGVPLD